MNVSLSVRWKILQHNRISEQCLVTVETMRAGDASYFLLDFCVLYVESCVQCFVTYKTDAKVLMCADVDADAGVWFCSLSGINSVIYEVFVYEQCVNCKRGENDVIEDGTASEQQRKWKEMNFGGAGGCFLLHLDWGDLRNASFPVFVLS